MSPKTKVLVADDEPVIADTLTIILLENGFKAAAAYSGEEVVEIANTFQPDILVADVVMAGMNGIEAATLVRDMLPSCKIVLLSVRGPQPAREWSTNQKSVGLGL